MEEQVDMIFHTINSHRNQFNVLAYTCHVFPESWLEILGNQIAPFLCTENNMEMVFGEGVGHVSPLRGFVYFFILVPTSYEVGYNIPSLPRLGL